MRRLPTEVRRAQVAEAALRLIANKGLRAFTTAALAREVGLSEGAIFRHFSGKDDIVEAAVDLLGAELFPQREPDGTNDPLGELRRFVEHRSKLLRDKPGYLRILLSQELAHAAPPQVKGRVASLRQRSGELVASIFTRAAAAGMVREDVSPHTLTALAQGLLLYQVFGARPLHTTESPGGGFADLWKELMLLIGPTQQAGSQRDLRPEAAAHREGGSHEVP